MDIEVMETAATSYMISDGTRLCDYYIVCIACYGLFQSYIYRFLLHRDDQWCHIHLPLSIYHQSIGRELEPCLHFLYGSSILLRGYCQLPRHIHGMSSFLFISPVSFYLT